MNIDEFRQYCLAKLGVTEETPFDEHTLVMKVAGKIYAITDLNEFDGIALKVNPEYGVELRERYSSIRPAYHMNKKHWISVSIDGKLPDSRLKQFIDDSYNLVLSKLSKRERLAFNIK